jgi:hypothetical protein
VLGIKNRVLFWFTGLVIIIGVLSGKPVSADYRPELSGDLEFGNKYYSEAILDEFPLDEEADYISSEDFIDFYSYKKIWLKYKQQLTRDNYYYVKGQYYEKDYENQLSYNNYSIDLWGNYTFRLSDRLRNKWTVNLREKNYYNNLQNSYNLLRMRYQLDFKYNELQDYTIYYQRQWEDYIQNSEKDNICDKLSLSLDYKLSDKCTINSSIQMDRELFGDTADSSNKYGKSFNIGFKIKL